MLFFMVFLILCQVTIVTNKNAGSTLFNRAHIKLGCWSVDDIAKLQARKEFEEIIPPPLTPANVNRRYVRNIIRYFSNALAQVEKDRDRPTAAILKEALSDTIGAHMYYEILPTIRFAYYAGNIPYRTAREAHNFFEQLKISMDTLGVGWRRPPQIPEWSNLTVAKITVGSGKLRDPCTYLIYRRDDNNCIHLPAPRTDNQHAPKAMVLPFEKLGLVSFMSSESENILLKYYTTVSRCILDSSPPTCRHADYFNFNNGFWHWMKREVAPHLADDELYSAFGGVLRIAAAVQNYGKGLSRRNLFEYHEVASSKWNPFKTLADSYISINSDWTPAFYVAVVMFTAVAICLLQACYNYVFGELKPCQCVSTTKATEGNDRARPQKTSVGYTKIDSYDFTPTLQQRSIGSDYCSDHQQINRHPRPKYSRHSTRTQVYDFNENKEKIMDIQISSKDDSDIVSVTVIPASTECYQHNIKAKALDNRLKSPPRIDATTDQLTLERSSKAICSNKRITKPMYSTSSQSRTDVYRQKMRESDSWSMSSTTTSGKSDSSTSSKSHIQRRKNIRDLAWARHVVSRHSRRSELD